MTNKEIRAFYQDEIKRCRHYLAQNTIRTSLEEHLASDPKGVAEMYQTMKATYDAYETQMDEVTQGVVSSFDALDAEAITAAIEQQILDALVAYQPEKPFNCILIEYDVASECSVAGAIASQLPINLEVTDELAYESLECRSMMLDLRTFLAPMDENEMYDAVKDAFNNELPMFDHNTKMYYGLVSHCLNSAFTGPKLKQKLAEKGFAKGGVGYLGKLDCGFSTVFIHED